MPIFAASSGMVIPGCPFTKDSASAARVPLPLRRPARRLAGRPGLRAALVVTAAALVREPRGRPGPRRRGAAVAVLELEDDPRTPANAAAAGSRRLDVGHAGIDAIQRLLVSCPLLC